MLVAYATSSQRCKQSRWLKGLHGHDRGPEAAHGDPLLRHGVEKLRGIERFHGRPRATRSICRA